MSWISAPVAKVNKLTPVPTKVDPVASESGPYSTNAIPTRYSSTPITIAITIRTYKRVNV